MKSKLILLLLSSIGQKRPKREISDRGFTLIEVIVAIVILSIFILTSLTALVIGLNFKLKAKLNNDSTLVIQQDLEGVRYRASYYGEIKTISSLSPISPASGLASGLNTITGTNLPLTIPIADDGVRVPYTLNQALTIGGQSAVYKVTSNQPNTSPDPILTSLLVTVDLSKLNIIKKATLVAPLSLTLNVVPPIPSFAVTDASNLKVGDRIVISPATISGTADIFVTTVTAISGNTVSFEPLTPTATKTVGNSVSILPRIGDVIAKTATLTAFKDCTYSSTTTLASDSIADKFIAESIPNSTRSIAFDGKTYRLTRAARRTSDKMVEVTYSVIEPTFSSTQPLIENFKTEVIPNVTFQCPK